MKRKFLVILIFCLTLAFQTDCAKNRSAPEYTLVSPPSEHLQPETTSPSEQIQSENVETSVVVTPLEYIQVREEILELPESLPPYLPDQVFISIDIDGFGPISPIFIYENFETVDLPEGVQGYVVDNPDWERENTNVPTVIGLLKDGKMALMKLDGTIATDFIYRFDEYFETLKGYAVIESAANMGNFGVVDIRTGGETIIPQYSRIKLYDGFIVAESAEGKLLLDYQGTLIKNLGTDAFIWTPEAEEGNELYQDRVLFDATTRTVYYPYLASGVSLFHHGNYRILTKYDYDVSTGIITVTDENGTNLFTDTGYESLSTNDEAVCIRYYEKLVVVKMNEHVKVYSDLPAYKNPRYINGELFIYVDPQFEISVDQYGNELSRTVIIPTVRNVGRNIITLNISGEERADYWYFLNDSKEIVIRTDGECDMRQNGFFIHVLDFSSDRNYLFFSDGTLLASDFYAVDLRLVTNNSVVIFPTEDETQILHTDGTIMDLH